MRVHANATVKLVQTEIEELVPVGWGDTQMGGEHLAGVRWRALASRLSVCYISVLFDGYRNYGRIHLQFKLVLIVSK